MDEKLKDELTGALWGLLVCWLITLLAGCKTVRYVPVYVHDKDSTHTETHTKIDYVKDTLRYAIPGQKAESTTRDSSHLENDYAVSDVRIRPDGTLHHTLETKPQETPIVFDKPVERKDSIIYKYRTRTDVMPMEMEKPLTWWQKFRMEAFWWLVAALAFLTTVIIFSASKMWKRQTPA